jgi:cytochrome c oxidase assembly protein subunit 15
LANDRLHTWFRRLALFATAFALVVVILGAYTRLSDAGLGCPDWPGCYGHLGVPDEEHEVLRANAAFPERPVEGHKAWKEMVHRYFAGTLGLLIAGLAVIAVMNRRHARQPVLLPLLLVGLVVFQALLGMWTVTLQLKPLVVMGHLLGGFATLTLLWWLAIGGRERHGAPTRARRFLPWATLGVVILVGQIALGGWTSSNYAALACPDFPQCQARWLPDMDFDEAFVLWRGLGVNYEFGVLDHPARTAIHFTHRVGAVVTAAYLGVLGLVILLQGAGFLRLLGAALLGVLTLQVLLGVSNIVFQLPLPVAVAHNAVAAILLLTLVTLLATILSAGPSHTEQRG